MIMIRGHNYENNNDCVWVSPVGEGDQSSSWASSGTLYLWEVCGVSHHIHTSSLAKRSPHAPCEGGLLGGSITTCGEWRTYS